MRISKIQLASGIAVAAMFGVAANNASAEDLNVTTATTTPVSTSDPVAAGPVAAGNVSIASGGSITVNAGQAAVTVDSNNSVTNSGQVGAANGANNSTGILLLGGNAGTITNNGNIALLEDYTLTDTDNDGDLDGDFATGTNRHGIRLTAGPTFTGDILGTGQINIEGNNSSGITLDALLTGNLNTTGAITVTGDNSYGVHIAGGAAGGVTGDVILRGPMTVRGQNSAGLVVDGAIGGDLIVNGAWSVTGFHTVNRPANTANLDADDLELGGPAIAVHYSVAGGIVIEGVGVEDDQDDDGDGTTEANGDTNDDASAQVVSYGSGAALLIEADPSANLVLGTTSTGYGLHVQGSLTGAAIYDGISGTGVRVQGSGGSTVTIADGIAIDGAVQATAADGNATALAIGADAIVSEILIRKTITSLIVTDNATRSARGVSIETGATVPELTNSGTMRVQVFGEGGDAIAISDASNTLATINNSGSIIAQLIATDADATDNIPAPPTTGDIVAIDVSASTIDVTFNQTADVPFTDEDAVNDDAENRPDVVTLGDIRFGSGNDTINLLAGEIGGNISFGVGTDVFLIDNGGAFVGQISDSDGFLTIDVQDGTLAHLGGTTNLTTANFSSDAALGILLSETPGASTFIHASGDITFAVGSEILPLVPEGLPVSGTHVFLTADGTLNGAANVTGVVDSAGSPFLYTLTIDTVLGDPDSLQASYIMKTAAQLGLTENQTIAFDPIVEALRQDDAAAAAFAGLSGEAAFFSAYDDLMPSYSAASTELAATAIQQMQSATTNRMAYTRLQGLDEVSAWVQEIAYGLNREPSDANGQEFRGNGFGLALGIDGPLDNGALFGLSAAFLASEAEEPARPEGEISSWFGQGNAYLGTSMGPVDLDFVVGGGFGQMRERRFVEIGPTFSAQTEAEWWAYEGHGSARASVPLQVGSWLVLTPQAALTYVGLGEEGYTEEGGGAAIDLEADDAFTQRLWGDVGLEVSGRWTLRGGGIVAPRIYGGYRANMIDDGGERTFRYVYGGSDFTLTDAALGDGGPLVGIGFDASNGWSTLAIGYEGEFGDQVERHSLNASIRFRF